MEGYKSEIQIMKREREGGKANRETDGFLGKNWESKGLKRKVGNSRKIFTIFVDDLPSMIDSWWLRREFKEFGAIVDAFIPRKSRAVTKSKFGFVRFQYRCEAERAIHMMNGIRRHGAILKVRMAQYGREIVTKFNDKLNWLPKKTSSIEVENQRDAVKMGRSYRDAVTGRGLTGSNGEFAEEGSILAVEVLASRVAVLELEVARLQHALISARSEGMWMKVQRASSTIIKGKQLEEEYGGEGGFASTVTEEQQKEEEDGGEGRNERNSGEGSSDLEEIVNGRDIWDNLRSKSVKAPEIASEISYVREKTDLLVADGSVGESIGVTPKKVDQGASAASLSGERWPAGSGEDSETGVINSFNAAGVWESKEGNKDAATIESVKGCFDDDKYDFALGLNGGNLYGKKAIGLGQSVMGEDISSIDTNAIAWANSRDVCVSREDEEALEELELYRQYFDNSKDRKQKDWSFSRMDKKPLRAEKEGDRKRCNSVNFRKRDKGQKKNKVKSKRRINGIFRWMGVKRRIAYVSSRRSLTESQTF